MTDVAQQPSSEPAATPAQADSSPLDAVYKEYGIEDQAQQFQPQSATPAAPQPQQPQSAPIVPKIPDPFSPEFSAYQAQIAQGVGSLHQALQETRGQLTAMQQVIQQLQQELGNEKQGNQAKMAEIQLKAEQANKEFALEAQKAQAEQDAEKRQQMMDAAFARWEALLKAATAKDVAKINADAKPKVEA